MGSIPVLPSIRISIKKSFSVTISIALSIIRKNIHINTRNWYWYYLKY